MAKNSLISVVDDDASVRESLDGFLRSVGFTVKTFPSAEEFLISIHLVGTDCLILDVRMPGLSGLELQRQLLTRERVPPIIFITADGDEEIKSQALAGGAVAFLYKPLREEVILSALNQALT